MRYVLLKKSKIFGALALSVVASSCSLKSNGQQQTVTIALPGAQVSQFQWLDRFQSFAKMTDWMSVAVAGSTTIYNLNDTPTTLTDFDCFAVNVTGPGIPPDPMISCSDPNDAPAIFGGFVPNGNSSIDLLVPAGSNRSIKILGVKTNLNGCPNLRDLVQSGTLQLKDNVSEFYTIGGANTDIFADTSINIKASYNANSPTTAFNNCERNDGKGGRHVWNVFAGTGPGNINATKTVNGVSFIGGHFDYVGPTTNQGAMLAQSNGAPTSISNSTAHINGTVKCSVPDGLGGFYVGGSFTRVGSIPFSASNPATLIHVAHDGSIDSSFVVKANSGQSINVCTFDRVAQTLFVAGNFTYLYGPSGGGVPTTTLAAIPLSTKTPQNMGSAFMGAPTPSIYAMDVDALHGKLYIGGYFNTTLSHANAAAFSTVSYAEQSTWSPNPNSSVSAVYADSLNNTVYLGGSFGNTGHAYLMRVIWSGLTGLIDSSWSPSIYLHNPVNSIAKYGSNLYVAGMDASSVPQIYRISAGDASVSNSLLSGGDSGASFLSIALSSDGSQLYVGGQFQIADQHQNLISLVNPAIAPDAPSTANISSNFMASANVGSKIYTVTANEAGDLYVGGDFVSVGGVLRNNIAAIDLSSGQATSWTSYYGNLGEVTAIESDGSYIYAASQAVGVNPPNVMRVSTSGGASGAWQHFTGSYMYDALYNLTLNQGTLYVGGKFFSLNSGNIFGNVARMDASTATVDTNWKPVMGVTGSSGSSVTQVAVDGSHVYIGGNFSAINGGTAGTMNSLAAIDGAVGATGSMVSGWNDPALSGAVDSMILIPANTYSFAPNGAALVGVGTNLQLVEANGSQRAWAKAPALSSYMLKTFELARAGNALYIAGQANAAGINQALLAYDLSNEGLIGSFAPGIQNGDYVTSLEVLDNDLILVGGKFRQVNISGNTPGGMMSWSIGLFDALNGKLY